MELHEIAVRCRGIHKDFGDGDARIEVLRGVDLTVRMGEMLFLVGPSGSGKTTLISVIAGSSRRAPVISRSSDGTTRICRARSVSAFGGRTSASCSSSSTSCRP